MKKITDPRTGVEYKSMKAMCDDIGINYQLFLNRKNKYKWSIEECLYRKQKDKQYKDPRTGIVYKTMKSMCDAVGIEYSVFANRRHYG